MKIKTVLTSLLLAATLTACSKPDVTGVWIPETTSSNDQTYTYYEIKKMDGTDRLNFIEHSFRVRPLLSGDKVPSKLNEITKILEFTKDNTYCVEGSLNTECIVSVDGDKLDIYRAGRFKKSISDSPTVPVNNKPVIALN